MPQMSTVARGLAGVLLLAPFTLAAAAAATDADAASAKDAFARFRNLAGVWQGTNSKGEEVRFIYEVQADGTAVLERFHVGSHDMLTVYHLDGNELMLTHYCAQGNQPRMKAVDLAGKVVRFELMDVTGLESADEGHMHRAAFEFDGPHHLASRWTFRQAGKDAFTETIDIHRVDSASR